MSNLPGIEVTHEVRDACLCLHVQRTARGLSRRFDDALRPLGLTAGQFSLLMALNRPEPPTMAPVAELLGMNRTTLTAALKPLERDGLVESMPDRKDQRARRLRITLRGRELRGQAVPLWRREMAALTDLLDGEADRLRALLRRIE